MNCELCGRYSPTLHYWDGAQLCGHCIREEVLDRIDDGNLDLEMYTDEDPTMFL
jgi:hypothetical protein